MNMMCAMKTLEIDINDQLTEELIRTQYKKLALKYHPDKSGNNSAEKFIEIKNAYEFLLCMPNKNVLWNAINTSVQIYELNPSIDQLLTATTFKLFNKYAVPLWKKIHIILREKVICIIKLPSIKNGYIDEYNNIWINRPSIENNNTLIHIGENTTLTISSEDKCLDVLHFPNIGLPMKHNLRGSIFVKLIGCI